jgi:hypothetical protein
MKPFRIIKMKKYLIVGLGLLIGMECSHSLFARSKPLDSCPGGYVWCSLTGQCVLDGQNCGSVLVDVSGDSLTVLEPGTSFSCVLETDLSKNTFKFQGYSYHVCQLKSGVVESVVKLNLNQYDPIPGTVYTFPVSAAVSCYKTPVQVSSSDELGIVYRCPDHK